MQFGHCAAQLLHVGACTFTYKIKHFVKRFWHVNGFTCSVFLFALQVGVVVTKLFGQLCYFFGTFAFSVRQFRELACHGGVTHLGQQLRRARFAGFLGHSSLLFCLRCLRFTRLFLLQSLHRGFLPCSILLFSDFCPCARTIGHTTGGTDRGQQTDLVSCFTVLGKRVSGSQRQSCLRPLQHLLGNFSRDFGQCTDSGAFGKCSQQTLICQLCNLRSRLAQQRFCGDTGQLAYKASAQRDKCTGNVKCGLWCSCG